MKTFPKRKLLNLGSTTPDLRPGQYRAANSLGTLASNLILTRALELTFVKRPALQSISLDLSDDRVKLGQSVVSRIFSVPSVEDFGADVQDVVDVDVPVLLDNYQQISHKFTSAQISSTDRNLVDEAAEPIAVALGNFIVDQVAALWTPANFPNENVQVAADCGYHTLNHARGILNGRGVPGSRFFSADSVVFEAMLNDPLCNRMAKVTDTVGDPISDGVLPATAGFANIFEYPVMPDGNNLVGFAGSKDSAVFCARVPRDPREILPDAPIPGTIGIVQDPISKLALMVVEYIDLTDLSANIAAYFMWGAAVGNPNNGERFVSAATDAEGTVVDP